MPDFNVRADSVNVEQIMEQIRARIREKRGADYTEQEIRELAAVKLEKFLDPRGVRSDLLEQFRRSQSAQAETPLPNFEFHDQTLYETHRAPIRWIRRLLNPLLKLFFNPNPLIQALHIQSQVNTMTADRDAARRGLVQLQYEVLHNLVIEATRLGIEVKNLKMRVESLAGRLEFNERRARALESVVVYKPSGEERDVRPPVQAPPLEQRPPREAPATATPAPVAIAGAQAPAGGGAPAGSAPPAEGPGQRSRRRRRRRGRRGGGSAAAIMGPPAQTPATSGGDAEAGRDAAGGHDETAETIEQALAADVLSGDPETGPGSDSDQ
jgi:hypothetical protein